MSHLFPLPHDLEATVQQALAEDIGTGDITAELLPPQTQATAQIISRENAVLCGQAYVDAVYRQLGNHVSIEWLVAEGATLEIDKPFVRLKGPANHLLTGERTALNFLQTLSATATATRQYVEAIAGTNARLLDTRKTIPGLRHAQKYAVRIGGGHNHRIGLFDAYLIKENHIEAHGSITAVLEQAKTNHPEKFLEIEVENLAQLQEVLTTELADRVLLDNFSLAALEEAVSINKRQCELEASGNITLQNIKAVAETGVDFISIGAITKHVKAIDLSFRVHKHL